MDRAATNSTGRLAATKGDGRMVTLWWWGGGVCRLTPVSYPCVRVRNHQNHVVSSIPTTEQ